MNKSEESSTQAPPSAASRPEVCPLCREPVVTADGAPSREAECRVCRFRFDLEELPADDARKAAPEEKSAVLEKWLSGAPLEPARPSTARRIALWLRRNRTLATAAAALLATGAMSTFHLNKTCRSLESALRQTTFERDEALGRCERLRIEAAEFARSVDEHVEESFRQAERNLRISIAREVAGEAADLSTRRPEQGLAMATVALRMAHRENAPPIPGALELVYGLSTRPIDEAGEVFGRADLCAISPDGSQLAVAEADGSIRLIRLTDRSASTDTITLPGRPAHVAALAFSGDGTKLIARSVDSTINLWRIDGDDVENQERTVLKVPESRMVGSAISGDNRWILTGCNGFRPGDTTTRLWELGGRSPSTNYFDLPGNRGRIQSVAVSRNGTWAAAGNHGGTVALWNTSLHPLRGVTVTLSAGRHAVNLMEFTADERKLVTSEGIEGGECTVRVWDLTAKDPAKAVAVLVGHVAPVRKLAVSANGRCVASGDDTGEILLWNLDTPESGTCVAKLEAHADAVTALEFSGDGRRLYTAGLDGRVCVWDLTRAPIERPLVRLKASDAAVTGLALSRDGRRMAAATADQNARLWLLGADDLLHWAHDGSRRRPGALTTPVATKEPSLENEPSAENESGPVPARRERPVIETAERSELNPLR